VEQEEEIRLRGGAVLEVDNQPVIAGPRCELGGDRRAQVEEQAEQRLPGEDPLAERAGGGDHVRIMRPTISRRGAGPAARPGH
jgi:hypothetical protein